MGRPKTRTCARLMNFVECWADMSARGQCDEMGGAEFQRCIVEFCEENLPDDAESFILIHANAMPTTEEERQGK